MNSAFFFAKMHIMQNLYMQKYNCGGSYACAGGEKKAWALRKTMVENIANYKEEKKMNERQAKKWGKHLDVKETKNCLEELKQKVKEIEECQKAQNLYQNRYYEECCKVKRYLKDKENNARKYAQLRDCMLDAIKFNEAEGKDIVEILKPLIEQFDFLLEQEGVRILKAKVKEKFNPEIHRPVSRVEVHHKRHNGKIAKVYNEGYWLEGQPAPFQKVMVAVCVYTPQYDFED